MSDYYEDNHYQDSTVMMADYETLVKELSDEMETSLSQANCYLWRHGASLRNMPVTGSDYSYVLRDIPFLSMVVSGRIPYYAEYVNFQANTHKFFLHLVEQGTRPAFLLTAEDPIQLQNTNSNDVYSSRYELYREMIVSWYRELSDLHEQLGKSEITDHVFDGDLVRVTWSNGTKVYLNFGAATGTLDGVTLAGGAYKVVMEP